MTDHQRMATRLWLMISIILLLLLAAVAVFADFGDTSRVRIFAELIATSFALVGFIDLGVSTYAARKYPSSVDSGFLLWRAGVGGTSSILFVVLVSLVADGAEDQPWIFLIVAPALMGAVFFPVASKITRKVSGAPASPQLTVS